MRISISVRTHNAATIGAFIREETQSSGRENTEALVHVQKKKERLFKEAYHLRFWLTSGPATPLPAQTSPTDPRRSIPPPSDTVTRPCNATERRERQSGESFSSDVPATWGKKEKGGGRAVRWEQSEHWKSPPPTAAYPPTTLPWPPRR